MYFCLYLKYPFTGADETEVRWNICEDKVWFPKRIQLPHEDEPTWVLISKQCKSFIKILLEKDPLKRPKVFELQNHIWLHQNHKDYYNLHENNVMTPELNKRNQLIKPLEERIKNGCIMLSEARHWDGSLWKDVLS